MATNCDVLRKKIYQPGPNGIGIKNDADSASTVETAAHLVGPNGKHK